MLRSISLSRSERLMRTKRFDSLNAGSFPSRISLSMVISAELMHSAACWRVRYCEALDEGVTTDSKFEFPLRFLIATCKVSGGTSLRICVRTLFSALLRTMKVAQNQTATATLYLDDGESQFVLCIENIWHCAWLTLCRCCI